MRKIGYLAVVLILAQIFCCTSCSKDEDTENLETNIIEEETDDISMLATSFRENLPSSAVKIDNYVLESDELDDDLRNTNKFLEDDISLEERSEQSKNDIEDIEVPDPPQTETLPWGDIKGISENGDENIEYYVLPKKDAALAMLAYKSSTGGREAIGIPGMQSTDLVVPSIATISLYVAVKLYSKYTTRKAAIIQAKAVFDIENLFYEKNKELIELQTENKKKLLEYQGDHAEKLLEQMKNHEIKINNQKAEYKMELERKKAEYRRQLKSTYLNLLLELQWNVNYSEKVREYILDALPNFFSQLIDKSMSDDEDNDNRSEGIIKNSYVDGNLRIFDLDLDIDAKNGENIKDRLHIIAERAPTDNSELCVVILKEDWIKMVEINTKQQFEVVNLD